VVLSIGLAVALGLVGSIAWWAVLSMGRSAKPLPEMTDAALAEPLNFEPSSAPKAWAPVTAATLADIAKPWAAKEFTFVDPLTHDSVPAMVIHLAAQPPNSSSSYWAFSLAAPYQTCNLEYVSDLGELAARFSFHAAHPMVASSCDGTLYDPLQMATIDSGAWVRGEIVQGAGIRPPISIEVKIEGSDLIADRIE
jgi:hypothetical protein